MFKVGDKVVCVNAVGMDAYLTKGKVYDVVVGHDDGITIIDDQDDEQWCFENRFEAVPPRQKQAVDEDVAIMPFIVGATVECLYEGYLHAKKGQNYKVESIQHDALGGVRSFRLEGIRVFYLKTDRFKVVAVPEAPKLFVREEWVPQVGEKVYITGKDKYSNGARMDAYINNGVVYTIGEIGGHDIHLEDHQWMYAKSGVALTPVGVQAVGAKPAVTKAPPPPQYSDLRDELLSKASRSLCSFAFEYETGKREFHHDGACHAALSSQSFTSIKGNGKERVKLAYNLPYQVSIVKEKKDGVSGWSGVCHDVFAHNKMADYIINRSPWTKAFLTKDMNEALEKGLFMDVEQNKNVIAAACVALRTCMEHSTRSNLFSELVNEGVGEAAAYLTACAIQFESKDKFVFTGWGGGHDILDKHRSFEGLIKFFKEGFHTEKGTTKEPFRTHYSGYVMADACANQALGADSVGEWFKANTEAVMHGEGFYKTSAITKQAVINVAKKLNNLIKD